MDWARILAYVTGMVERATLGEIGYRLGRNCSR